MAGKVDGETVTYYTGSLLPPFFTQRPAQEMMK